MEWGAVDKLPFSPLIPTNMHIIYIHCLLKGALLLFVNL